MSGKATGALSQTNIDAFGHLAAVVTTLAEERQKTNRIPAALEILLQRTLNVEDTSAPEINEPGMPKEGRSPGNEGQNSFQMKPSNPPDFDGDQAKGQGFLSDSPACILDAPVPMDVDRAHGRTTVSNLVCRRCSKIGHIAKFCNADFDIRALTTDEKTELLYQLMTDLDTVEQPQVESENVAVAESEEEQDFVVTNE
ncbi:hypothetical protein M422DRAFT_249241 [Sphaerobolus stellatus SS14]|uniref:CCHC-type domain-containing protein n=1 Tax=Sphaerobolus stellatus (strain SS14) TaxID=990650 RepID=A0A0C9W442_SPHS4|nr:hypothetical protein M422DRAFT_249241 [Sphaerobolus stellatus SS14]